MIWGCVPWNEKWYLLKDTNSQHSLFAYKHHKLAGTKVIFWYPFGPTVDNKLSLQLLRNFFKWPHSCSQWNVMRCIECPEYNSACAILSHSLKCHFGYLFSKYDGHWKRRLLVKDNLFKSCELVYCKIYAVTNIWQHLIKKKHLTFSLAILISWKYNLIPKTITLENFDFCP